MESEGRLKNGDLRSRSMATELCPLDAALATMLVAAADCACNCRHPSNNIVIGRVCTSALRYYTRASEYHNARESARFCGGNDWQAYKRCGCHLRNFFGTTSQLCGCTAVADVLSCRASMCQDSQSGDVDLVAPNYILALAPKVNNWQPFVWPSSSATNVCC
eukprot:SAG31_NODE_4962_length_2834_cov_1.541865_3_plen_162_part_00